MLHKTSKVRGYHIEAVDGSIGHVDDFLFDEAWGLRYLVVDTSNWIGGKWVLISTAAVEKVDSPNQKIFVTLKRDEIERSPSLDTANIELVETLSAIWIM
jgi:PRC-barrel domain